METIEQIKQERDKLQERLNNAAKIFREQKAQIETLTKENEELKNEKKEITLDYSEEVLKENNELKVKLQNSNEAYEELRKKYQEMKELTDGDLKRYNELEDNYEGLQNKYQELEKQKNEAEEKAKMLNDNLRGVEKTTDSELKKAYEERDSWLTKYKELESNFNEVNEKNLNTYKDLQEKFDKLNKDHLELKDLTVAKERSNKTLQDTNNELYTELNELKETNNKNVSYCEDLKKKYDDLENEKLSWEADYKNLEDKFNLFKRNKEIDDDVLENVMNAIKQIYQITDDILDPKPVDIAKDDNIKLPSPTNTQKGKKSPIGEKSNNFGLHDLGESAII